MLRTLYMHFLFASKLSAKSEAGWSGLSQVVAEYGTYIMSCSQAHPNPSVNWSHLLLNALRLPNIMHEEVPNKPLDYYTCPFKKSKLDR